MFAFFESRIRPTALPGTAPPQGLLAFYWHYVRQARGLFGTMFATGLLVALIDTLIPLFIGRLVRLMESSDRAAALAEQSPMLVGMAALVLIGRPLALLLDSLVRNNAVRARRHQPDPLAEPLACGAAELAVLPERLCRPHRQPRHADRNAVRECVVSSIRAVWYIVVYGVAALLLMSRADWRLAIPTALWFVGYVVFLRRFVPRMRDLPRPAANCAAWSWAAWSTATPTSSPSSCSPARATKTPTCVRSSTTTPAPSRATCG